jgi:hypothetical protein
MNTKLCLLALPALLFAGAAQALPACDASSTYGACVVNFADLSQSNQSFFQTKTDEVVFWDTALPGTQVGFTDVATVTGSSYVAVNYRGRAAPDSSTFASRSGQLFSLDNFVMASGSRDQTVVFTGYDSAGAVKYTQSLNLTTTAGTYRLFDSAGNPWTDLGSFSITAEDLSGNGSYWALNGVSVTVVPEPETYAMLLAGLGLMGAVARIRRKGRV